MFPLYLRGILSPEKVLSWLMQFEAAVVDHGATMVNMTPSF
jgi:hypothetical protein